MTEPTPTEWWQLLDPQAAAVLQDALRCWIANLQTSARRQGQVAGRLAAGGTHPLFPPGTVGAQAAHQLADHIDLLAAHAQAVLRLLDEQFPPPLPVRLTF